MNFAKGYISAKKKFKDQKSTANGQQSIVDRQQPTVTRYNSYTKNNNSYTADCRCFPQLITFAIMQNASVATLNDKYFRLLGIPLTVVALMLAQMPFFFPGDWVMFWKSTALGVFFTALMWEMARIVLIRVRRRFPEVSQTAQRLGWMFLGFFVLFALTQWFITWVFLVLNISTNPNLTFFETWLMYFACSLFFVLIISGIYEATYFFSQYKSVFHKAEALKKSQALQNLESLKNRVNPHFLFNSLTSLSALIGEDTVRAERFVDELSKVYRYLLRAGNQSRAMLCEELQFADSYAFLLENRFETGAFRFDRTQLSQQHIPDLEAKMDQLMPVLSLQNALDYIVLNQNTPLNVGVELGEDALLISCEDQPKLRSFDLKSTGSLQLEQLGIYPQSFGGRLEIRIPLASNNPA